jgi:hypothetical protein
MTTISQQMQHSVQQNDFDSVKRSQMVSLPVTSKKKKHKKTKKIPESKYVKVPRDLTEDEYQELMLEHQMDLTWQDPETISDEQILVLIEHEGWWESRLLYYTQEQLDETNLFTIEANRRNSLEWLKEVGLWQRYLDLKSK